jgi:hypothetical protein
MKIEIKGKVIFDWPQKGSSVQVVKTGQLGTVIHKRRDGRFIIRLQPDYKFSLYYENELQLPQQLRVVHDMLKVMEIEREIGRDVTRQELDQGSFTARTLGGMEHTYNIPALAFPYDLFTKASDFTTTTGNRWTSYEAKYSGNPPHRDFELESLYQDHAQFVEDSNLSDSDLESEAEDYED